MMKAEVANGNTAVQPDAPAAMLASILQLRSDGFGLALAPGRMRLP
jgi:hypothetical protein